MDRIEKILQQASELNASDILLCSGKKPAYRLCGEIDFSNEAICQPEELEAFRVKILSHDQERRYQSDRNLDIAFTDANGLRFRLNFFMSFSGPGLAARPLQSGDELFFQTLNLPESLQELCIHRNGLVLIAGATGQGKTSTLGAMLNFINRHTNKHILTIEDPVEYLFSDHNSLITQREMNSLDHDFLNSQRNILRSNPDVIVIGEMRDSATVRTALTAAFSGHLVLATLHAADTIQAIQRLLDLCGEQQRLQIAHDLGMTLRGIIGQRLLPMRTGGGRIPALEILLGTPLVQKLISEQNYIGLDEALRHGENLGMISFNRYLHRLCQNSLIATDVALRASDNPAELELLLRGMDNGTDAFQSSRYCANGEAWGDEAVDMRRLLRSTVKNGASDLLLSVNASPTLRINGEMRALDLPELSPPDTEKLLFSLLSARQRVEFEENRELDFALSVSLRLNKNDAEISQRFRINAFFQRGSIGMAVRTISNKIPAPEELALPPQLLELIKKQQGLFLVTGPTGSGKSTTLACLIDQLNNNTRGHIITIEDPIEFVHTNKQALVEQRELHSDTLGFATAIKSALRQDPDIILVGEMRDTETIAAAITAAETGHLVFATVHTNSAPQTIDRIIDSFPPNQQNQIRQQLSSTLLAVVAQRLLHRSDGKGRIAAFEIMVGTPPVQALIREGKTGQLPSVLETGSKDGMITLRRSLDTLVQAGAVRQEEAQSYLLEAAPVKAFS